jgi:hypothetical protein
MPCYNYNQLTEDVKAGLAYSFVGEKNIINGIDRIIAIYADGRAYAWHQKAK